MLTVKVPSLISNLFIKIVQKIKDEAVLKIILLQLHPINLFKQHFLFDLHKQCDDFELETFSVVYDIQNSTNFTATIFK